MRPGTALVLATALLAGCSYSLTSPTPAVVSVDPQLVCTEQLVTTLQVNGTNFTPLPSAVLDSGSLILPGLTITRTEAPDGTAVTGDPVSVDGSVTWDDDNTMHFDVSPDLGLDPGVYDLDLTNPDGQVAHFSAALQGVPAPVVNGANPSVFCLDEQSRTVTLSGSGFLQVGNALPTVTIGDQQLTPDSLSDCSTFVGPVVGKSCNTLTVTIPQGALADGVYDLVVTNPETAACHSEQTVQVDVTPPPVLDTIQKDLLCDAQSDSTTFTLTGKNFVELGGDLPTVTIGTHTAVASALTGTCTPLPVGDGQQCTGLTVTFPSPLEQGVLAVSVTNPAPADCTSSDDVTIENLPPPTVTSLVPDGLCTQAGDTPVDIFGTGFLVTADGAVPSVSVGGQTFVPTVDTTSCTDLTGPEGGSVCTHMTIEIPAGTFATVQNEPVLVTNPDPAACDSRASDVSLAITPPPTITNIDPLKVCGGGHDITITGTGFTDAATVTAGGRDLTVDSVTHNGDGTDTIVATFPADMAAGFYSITVTNPDGCSVTWGNGDGEQQVEVTKLPVVFFADPEVTYQPVPIQSKVYLSGINTSGDPVVGVTDVQLTDPSGTTTSVPTDQWSWSADQPSRLFVNLMSGMDVGAWDLTVTDAAGCQATLTDAFTVSDTANIVFRNPDPVSPQFGWASSYTPVDIYSVPTNQLTGSQVNFQDVPHLYLNPTVGGAVATEVYAVDYQAPDHLGAIVPQNLTPGAYDLLVINPDDSIGYLPSGFRVTAIPPPIIDNVAPGSLPSGVSTNSLVLTGQHFPTGSTVDSNPDAAVYLDCEDPSGNTTYNEAGPLYPTSPTSTQLTVTFDTTPYGNGAVCVVRLENRANNTYDEFSSVSVTNPAENLYAWHAGPDLNEARRAPAVAAGRVTRTNRFVYAIGGDDGAGTASSTIEWAQVGRFGDIGAWDLPYDRSQPGRPFKTDVYLPAPRTLAGVTRIGRFVYLVGGEDNSGVVSTVLRAQILDPLDAPRITDLSVDFADPQSNDGVVGGTWIYRVSALYAADDPSNPGGESLASDPFVVRLPSGFGKLLPTIKWTAPPDSTPIGYRIYRTPAADSGSGSEDWLTDVGDVTSFEDHGAGTQGGKPLPTGALGRWYSIDLPAGTYHGTSGDVVIDAPAPRAYPCVASAVDPADPTGTAYVYVGGGLSTDSNGNPVVLSGVQALDIDVVSEHEQDVVGWFTPQDGSGNDATLPDARWQCWGNVATSDLNALVTSGNSWVYFGSGASNPGGTTYATHTMAGLVGSGGDFDAYVDLANDMPNRAGYGAATANDQLYIFGGKTGGPATSSASGGALCGSTTDVKHQCTGKTPNSPPDVKNWNAQTSLPQALYLLGSAQESSVIFAVGGQTAGGSASTIVNWTNY